MPGQHSSVAPRAPHRAFGALALAVVGGTLIAFGLHGDVSTAGVPPAPKVVSTKDLVRLPRPQPLPKITTDRPGLPVSLKIPAIDVKASITRLGLNTDQTVQVPKDPDDAGWYSKGPRPGENGSAVILGHVDSTHGPAVFYRLKSLGPGDRVAVKLSDDSVAHYQVVQVALYANKDFPAQAVYAASSERPALNLVTCGGTYDRKAGGYQSNVVVYTKYLWATSPNASPQRPATKDS